jgi:hypothetical protein
MWKVFIVSSNQTLSYAQVFQRELMNSFSSNQIDVIGWWEPNKVFQNGDSTLDSLLQESKNCDFVVVFLSPDYHQERNRSEHNDANFKIPSGNCVFELGIFLSALQPNRCFVLSSVESEKFRDFLSDFRGITYYKVSSEELKNGCRQQRLNIKQSIENLGHRTQYEYFKSITTNKLKELERYRNNNGNLRHPASIVVNNSQPLETDINFAKRVKENINSNAKYYYFFCATGQNIVIISELLQALATAHLNDDNARVRFSQMQDSLQETKNNLSLLKRHVKINFLKERPPIEYCIHNAHSENYAKCYLRHPLNNENGIFVEWSVGRRAYELADNLLSQVSNSNRGEFIFQPTREIDIYSDKYRNNFLEPLKNGCLNLFPRELHDTVNSVCFKPNL